MCPYCNENRKGRCNHKGHWGYRAPKVKKKKRWVMSKYVSGKGSSGASSVYVPEESERPLAEHYEALVEYLTLSANAEGVARERATLMVVWEEGMWKLGLNDRECGRSCWMSGRTLFEVVESLEVALRSCNVSWRSSGSGGSGKKR